MTITTTIEVKAVVTVVESPGQAGARQSDGAPLEPSFEREAHIQSVELPDAEGAGVRWSRKKPRVSGWYWWRCLPAHEGPRVIHVTAYPNCIIVTDPSFAAGGSFAGPLPLPGHATPAHLPVESLSPTDAQRILRLAEREEDCA